MISDVCSGTQCHGDWHHDQASPLRTATETDVPAALVVRSNEIDERVDRSSVGAGALRRALDTWGWP